LPNGDDQRPSTLDFFLSSNPNISTGFIPLGGSDQVAVNIDCNTNTANDSSHYRTL